MFSMTAKYSLRTMVWLAPPQLDAVIAGIERTSSESTLADTMSGASDATPFCAR
jgi:hypothetical protein